MPSLFRSLGNFASKIISTIRETGASIAQAIGIARPLAPTVTEQDVIRDVGTVTRLKEKESLIADLPRGQVIPDYLYTSTEIPFKRPFAYTVTIQGRALAGRTGEGGVKIGGQFVRDEFNITASRELTPEEIIDEAFARFGASGAYPLVSIRTIAVTAAMKR